MDSLAGEHFAAQVQPQVDAKGFGTAVQKRPVNGRRKPMVDMERVALQPHLASAL